MKKTLFAFVLPSAFFFLADQFLKELTILFFHQPVYLLSWLSFRYERNFGIAWSIPVPRTWLLGLTLLLLIMLPYFFIQTLDTRKSLTLFILSLLAGGALGNLYDRILRGYVIDFLSIGSFPVFNLADTLLCVGIFLIFLFYDKIKRI